MRRGIGIVERSRRPAIDLLSRCLTLRCPACGRSSIFQSPFRVRHHCPACGAIFQREDGFFAGAIMVNMVTTELVILAVYLTCLAVIGPQDGLIHSTLFALTVLVPAALYHHCWGVWLSLVHLIEPLPKHLN